MADYILVKFPGEAPYRLADLHGVLIDLRSVAGLCAGIIKKMAADAYPRKRQEVDSLQEAAIVRYARCFKGGARTAFVVPADWIEGLPEHLRTLHQQIIHLRDKHIAHSVNDWEINWPVIYMKHDRNSGSYEVSQVLVQHHRIVALPDAGMTYLRELAMALADMVEAEEEAERARLLEVAKAIPIDDLVARIADSGVIPGLGALDEVRGR